MQRTEAPKEGAVAHIVLPRRFLFATQEPSEFKKDKMKRVTQGMKQMAPQEYLNEKPIQVIGIEVANGLQFLIWEGHTRSRLAGRHQIRCIPSLIYTIEYMAELTQKTPEELARTLDAFVAESERQYEGIMMQKKGAYIQKEVLPLSSLEELVYVCQNMPHALLHYGIDVVESGT